MAWDVCVHAGVGGEGAWSDAEIFSASVAMSIRKFMYIGGTFERKPERKLCVDRRSGERRTPLLCSAATLYRQSESPPCETAQAQRGRMRYSASMQRAACRIEPIAVQRTRPRGA